MKTAELCFRAVKKCGYAIEYVPDSLMTAELCFEAVKQNGLALEYIPDGFRTEKLCIVAIEQVEKAMEDSSNPRELWLAMYKLLKKLKLIK